MASTTRISVLQLRHVDRLSLGHLNDWAEQGLPQAKPPEPWPCLYYGRSQSICVQCQQPTHWIHRGQFAQPAGYTLKRPVDLAAPTASHIYTFTFHPQILLL